jgi:hypothetical protein
VEQPVERYGAIDAFLMIPVEIEDEQVGFAAVDGDSRARPRRP